LIRVARFSTNKTMNTFVVFAGLLALATGAPMPTEVEAVPALVHAPLGLAPTLIRAPAHDSASIESHRLGGNFAYAIAEAHAYAQVTPQLSTITHPVAETTVVHEPAAIAHVTPGEIITTKHIPQPIIEHQPILAQEPIIATKTVAHPTFQKVQTVTHHVEQPAVVAHTPVFHHAPALGHHVAAPAAHFAHQPYALPEGHAYAPHVAPAHAAAAWAYHH